MASSGFFIEARGLRKTYGSGEALVRAVDGIDLAVAQGEFLAMMGPSGSGKSTLLALLGALTTPQQGSYHVDGIDVYTLSSDQRADFRREYLGFVFQEFHLVPYLSLLENVMLPLAIKRLPTARKQEMASEALERVGLGNKLLRLPGQVSGGEQERTALARAIVNQPPVLLADEPTGNLDVANTQAVMELLSSLAGEGTTIVMVTHSPQCASYAGRQLRVCDGRLESDQRSVPVACAG